MRVLLNFNAMFYTRWSRWSSCSRSCLTRRYRSEHPVAGWFSPQVFSASVCFLLFFFSTFLFVILRVTMTYDFYIPVSMVCTLLVPSSFSFLSFSSSSSFSLYSFLSFSSYSSPCPHISLLYPLRNFSSHFIVLSDVR